MTLKLFNTLTRKVEPFNPIKEGKASIYSCGPTVYDYAHIGNFRAYICSDILVRYMEFKGLDVKQVMNLTDVDDKTIRESNKLGISLDEYTKKYKDAFFEDLKTLNIKPADVYPEATTHIKEMVQLVKKLKDNNHTYESDGSIYFKITSFDDYGKLANINQDELQAGARVDSDEYEKESAHDFVLWKGHKEGEPFWETELGKGRPGWHIECSAMATKHLGNHFDIHTGGIDLIFPHHQNEIAQTEGATKEKFVNYWVHNEYLMVNGKKMSKSLGNFYTLRDLLDKGFKPRAIRYLLLSAHYRTPLNFTEEGVKAAEQSVQRLLDFMSKLAEIAKKDNDIEFNNDLLNLVEKTQKDFEDAMDDDLNISKALAAIFEMVKEVNKTIADNKLSSDNAQGIRDAMLRFDTVLGILEQQDPIDDSILKLAEKREEARKNKDFSTADKIRDELKEKGYVVEDTPDGPRVKKI